jgi:pyruvate-ferredoxin/flavodoxin oxidoreductase
VLDSKAPTLPLGEFMYNENRFNLIKAKDAELADSFLHEAEHDIHDRYERLNLLKGL